MTASLNRRALALVERLLTDPDATGVAAAALPGGARLVDCGAQAPGGLEAGRVFAEACMGGLGRVTFAPVVLEGRWWPGLTVVTDRPALACLAAQYAGWKLEHDDWFAMASGPGRALVRAEPIFDDLRCDEQDDVAVLALEARTTPPAAIVERVAQRSGVDAPAITLLLAPTASLAGGVQVAARVVETALHKLHELEFDVHRVTSGFGTCPLPPVAASDVEAIGRTNDAVLYGGQVHLTVDAGDDELEDLAARLPASASRDHGAPFGAVLERAGYDFYKIDPLLFSPAEVTLTSLATGRSFRGGRVALDVLERSFTG